jgi:cephalosporin-C deacetylase-like acetyl esterase
VRGPGGDDALAFLWSPKVGRRLLPFLEHFRGRVLSTPLTRSHGRGLDHCLTIKTKPDQLVQSGASMANLTSRTRIQGMPREDVSFQTADNVTLRGWFYKPATASGGKVPCLVMAHGFSAVKEMDLDAFAEFFTSKLALACLVYDNRGFGTSDNKEGEPRQEIIPSKQISDYSDAITYAQMREEVDRTKIGIWGSSYSGGHVLHVGAMDRRVKVVLSQLPLVDGWANFHRLIRPDFVASMNDTFEQGKCQDQVY